MYCNKCGSKLNKNASFCPECGTGFSTAKQSYNNSFEQRKQGGNIGYSPKINDPAIIKYAKNTKLWTIIFALIIATIAIVGFYIAGEVGSEMDNPESLYIGFIIGGMFILIASIQILSKSGRKSWDGIVVDKRIEKKKEKKYYSDSDGSGSYHWQEYMAYTVFIRDMKGKIHESIGRNDDTKYNYYKIGDHVRFHGFLGTYEKYDKSGDSIIFCNCCADLNDISDEICFRCKSPLLK